MKILCLPYTHALSHISRPLAVAEELRTRGHEVVFAGESDKKGFIERQGFAVHPLFEPDPAELFGNIRAGRLRFVSDAVIDRMIEADLELFRGCAPDLVLTDGRFSAPISTHLAGLPHAAIVNVSSTAYRALPYIPFFDWLPAELLGGQGCRAWLNRLNLKLEMAVFDRSMARFGELSRTHRLAKPVSATSCLVGKDLTLLPDLPEYFPTRNLPDDYHYVGPLTWESSLPAPSWWPPRHGGNPLVYLTMGSTGIGDFFTRVYGLFRNSGFTAIVTTGGQSEGLATLEGEIYVEPFIDGDLVMEACDVVVCHGGNGTIYQALRHAKPVIGIPTIPDQKFNMRRVEALGVGKMLSWKEFERDPAGLLRAIGSVCQDRGCHARAKELQKSILSYTPPQTAADLVEQLLERSSR